MNELLAGAILAASLVIGLLFLRFWRSTGDRIFVHFALSFRMAGADCLLLLPSGHWGSRPERMRKADKQNNASHNIKLNS